MSEIDVSRIIIISGPSGVGEDSIIEKLAEKVPVNRVITTTTRAKRPGESDGHPYYFIDKETFQEKIRSGEMVEWAKQYNGEYYGVTKEELERVTRQPGLAVWKIEYQGVAAMKKKFPGLKAILILADSLEVLENRLRRRGNYSEDYITERMAYTKEWLKHTDLYDYTIINREGKLDEAAEELYTYLVKEGYIRSDNQ